ARALQVADDLEAVHLGHLHVEENKVGMLPPDGRERLLAIGAFGGDLDVGFLLQQVAEAVAGQRLVVGNQDSHGFLGVGDYQVYCCSRQICIRYRNSTRTIEGRIDLAGAGCALSRIMNRTTGGLALAVAVAGVVSCVHGPMKMAPIEYPETRKEPVTDVYHGTAVVDPYRWLEDDNAPETAAWVEAQNRVTFAYLESIPERAAISNRLKELWNFERWGTPSRRGDRYFVSRNDGLQNQSVV